MGANLTTEHETNGSPMKKGGQVIVFHSSTKWRIHFEASKQASKLVNLFDFLLLNLNQQLVWCKILLLRCVLFCSRSSYISQISCRGHCHQIQPSVTEFAEKYTDVDFIQNDDDELHEVAEEFGVQVMPSFMLLKRGKVADKVVGAKREDLQKKIEKRRF